MAWTATLRWGGQVVSWGTTIEVARLLTPRDYGLAGMAAVFLALIRLFSDFGIGDAAIAFRDLRRAELSQLHTTSVTLGLLGFAISAGIAHPLGLFFHAPELPAVLVVAAIGILIIAFRTIPYARLQKDMRFKLVATIELIQIIVQSIAMLLLALFGFGYWALVLGLLLGRALSTVLALTYEPVWFALPHWKQIETQLKFSWRVITGSFFSYGYDNADMWIVGRVLGEASLGAYSLAYSLAHAPAEKLVAVTNRVALSLFSAVSTDLPSVRRYLRNLTQGIALIIFPVGIGVALMTPDFFHLVFGKKWDSAIVPLQLLTLYASFRAIRTLFNPLLNALGEPRISRKNHFQLLIALPPCFYIGSYWGLDGVAACWIVVYPLMTLPLMRDVFRKIEMSKREYVRAIWPALSSCIPMLVTVIFLKRTLSHDLSLYLQFTAEVFGGAGVYCLTLLAFHRERLLAFLHLRRLVAEAG